MIVCDHCGAENADARSYCHSCGKQLVGAPSRAPWFIIVIVTFLFVICIPLALCGLNFTVQGIDAIIDEEPYSWLPGFLVISVPSLILGVLGIYLAVRILRRW